MGCVNWGGYGIGFGFGPWLLLCLVVIVGATMLVRGRRDSAQEVLDRRYARGEISKEQYEDMCASMGSPR